jgi:hypothetical protein
MKTLLTFGDSWPRGAELQRNQQPYGHWLCQLLNYDNWQNFADGGTSLEHLILQLQEYLNVHDANDQVTAIFFLTNPVRTAYFKNNLHFRQTTSPGEQEQWLYFQDYVWLRASIAIAAAQQACRLHNIDDYYFSGWIKYDNLLPIVQQEKIWKMAKETVIDWFGADAVTGEFIDRIRHNQYVKPNLMHPNELGHKLIAERLASWIAQVQTGEHTDVV